MFSCYSYVKEIHEYPLIVTTLNTYYEEAALCWRKLEVQWEHQLNHHPITRHL